jgi:gas vesicle protein
MKEATPNKEQAMESSNTSAGTVILSVLGGAILGAGIALLYAPQSGRSTRRKLGQLGEDAGDYARELMKEASEGAEKVRHTGEEWVRRSQEFMEDAKQQVAATMDGAKAKR